MKAALSIAALILLPTTSLAALPPQYQRAAEMRAVIDAAAHVLGTEIESVRFLELDRYEVRAGPCILLVDIVGRPQEPGLVGPRQFDAVPGAPVCKQ